jgi:hypothetical protein
MQTDASGIQTFCRGTAIVLAAIFLGGPLAFAGPAQPTKSFPAKITTKDGVTYKNTKH